ncbi:acyltransferase [Phenylobacterium sp.]|uniref:acyltransferase family protein n=1 Tax=Phenylobacterium sp. TaxID=1871053 RepID=UPI001208F468|nr:acyltransferase [Phenylobacterium sp.]THD52622.1 MAG: acyltransferase [Phenylobacterium sp.]
MNAPDGSRDPASRYVFLDYLRAVAAWLVVWDHMANLVPQRMGQPFAPAGWVRDNVTDPLGIIQDFGWFGVVLFFLISGFIISDRAAVESPYRFVVRRLLRIYPMMAVAVALSIALGIPSGPLSLSAILLNISLINYVVVPQVVLVGVAWTLIIEMVFYALTALTQFMWRSPHRIAINLAFVTVVICQRSALGPNFVLFATVVSYLPVLVMGQVIYWWLAAKRLSWPFGLAYLTAAWSVFLLGVRAIHPEFAPAANSYAISVAYGLLLFVALLNVRLPEWRVVRFLSDTSYSVYLIHGLLGEQLLILMIRHHAPVTLAIAVAAAVSLGASWVTFRLVERPTQRLARALTRSR